MPPDLSKTDRVLLLLGVIIEAQYLFFSFKFALLLNFVVLPSVLDSAPSRLIPFEFLKVCGEACVRINTCGIFCGLVLARAMVGVLY